jgi:hypothetical protein
VVEKISEGKRFRCLFNMRRIVAQGGRGPFLDILHTVCIGLQQRGIGGDGVDLPQKAGESHSITLPSPELYFLT